METRTRIFMPVFKKQGATVMGVSIYSYTQASDTQAIEDLVKKF
jgi:hypothetical protein